MNFDEIKSRLAAQGAVMPGEGVISEIAVNLALHVWTAIPGMGVYHTAESNVYRLELEARYKVLGESDFQVGLPMYDSRARYLRHEFDRPQNRVMVYFEVIE